MLDYSLILKTNKDCCYKYNDCKCLSINCTKRVFKFSNVFSYIDLELSMCSSMAKLLYHQVYDQLGDEYFTLKTLYTSIAKDLFNYVYGFDIDDYKWRDYFKTTRKEDRTLNALTISFWMSQLPDWIRPAYMSL